MKQLKGKIVLVTGGASGIGKIMVRLLLERAAKVIIWDINELKIAETISEFQVLPLMFLMSIKLKRPLLK
jgi:all-trans-retinol dehydrogenase (NAD+)